MTTGRRRIGRYELLRRIGLSSSSEVFEGRDTETGARVAIKRMLPHALEDPAARARFEREVRLTLAQAHPGLARGIEAIRGPGQPGDPCLVMHLEEGVSLKALRDAPGPRPSMEALTHLARAAAESLRLLHQDPDGPRVHGDLSARNIIALPTGQVTLLDLGATIEHGAPAVSLSTPRYASPARRDGRPMTTQDDLFALGAILHELATGQRAASEGAADLPGPLGAVIGRCLATAPEARLTDADALLDALDGPPEDQRAAWCDWIAPEAEATPSEEPKELTAWFGLVTGVLVTLWTAAWFIGQTL